MRLWAPPPTRACFEGGGASTNWQGDWVSRPPDEENEGGSGPPMLEVFSGRFLPPRPQEGGRADPNPVPGWRGAVWRAWALPGDSLGVAQRGARAGLGGDTQQQPVSPRGPSACQRPCRPEVQCSSTALRSTYSVTTALLRPPARHTMSAMASARQRVLWESEGCSCLRTNKETHQ